MKSLLFLFFITLLITVSCSSKTETGTRGSGPNIILILTDDQGIGDIGFNGNPYIKTPVLDSLAAAGTILKNFYVSPVCAPTRSSLLTGRYSVRTGIHDTYNGGATMASGEVTIAEVLKENGYVTGMFGKWHLGDNYPFRPSDQGFDVSVHHKSGGIGQVGDVDNYYSFDSSYFNPVLYYNNEPLKAKGYCSDIFANEAVQFINDNPDKPFFLYLSFNAPHTPLQLPGKYYEMYDDLTKRFQSGADTNFYGNELSDREYETARRVYGMVSNIDDNIAKLISAIKKNNLEDNTIIIFMSDNGPQQNRYRMGYRGLKGSVYEGGVKVPAFIISSDTELKEITQTIAHIDIFPTILDMCKIDYRTNTKIDGLNFYPLLNKNIVEAMDNRILIFNWQRGFPEPYRNIAVRRGDFKLVGQNAYNTETDQMELFNLRKDPGEQNNIIAGNLDVAEELKEAFNIWYNEILLSQHLRNPKYPVAGTDNQKVIVLTRNDAKGPPGIWAQDDIYGYWDIAFAEDREYDITIVFKEPLTSKGRLTLKLAPIQRTVINNLTGISEIKVENIHIIPGKYILDTWYEPAKGRRILPFYIIVE